MPKFSPHKILNYIIWSIVLLVIAIVPIHLSHLLKAEYQKTNKLTAQVKSLKQESVKMKKAFDLLSAAAVNDDNASWQASAGEATAYAPYDDRDTLGGNAICSTGMIAGEHVFAVDPRIIPYYSKVIVLHKDGSISTGIAGDTGGTIIKPGKVRIDEFKQTYEEAMNFGRQQVTILWQAPKE